MSQLTRATEEVVEKVEHAAEEAVEVAHREAEAYRGDEPRPLGSLLAVIASYLALVGVAGAFAVRRRRWPENLSAGDLLLGLVATHQLSMMISKDTITAPLRAPFTEFRGPAGEGKLEERVRGTGWRKAVGELVTCPFCLAHWFATLWAIGHLFAPRPTRMVAAMLTTAAGADWLHRLQAKLND